MTPFRLAQQECANSTAGGRCLALSGPCRLGLRPLEPCEYFETCVLPLVSRVRTRREAEAYAKAARAYEKATGYKAPANSNQTSSGRGNT